MLRRLVNPAAAPVPSLVTLPGYPISARGALAAGLSPQPDIRLRRGESGM